MEDKHCEFGCFKAGDSLESWSSNCRWSGRSADRIKGRRSCQWMSTIVGLLASNANTKWIIEQAGLYDCFRSDHLVIADGVPESRRRDPAPGLRRYTTVRYIEFLQTNECQCGPLLLRMDVPFFFYLIPFILCLVCNEIFIGDFLYIKLVHTRYKTIPKKKRNKELSIFYFLFFYLFLILSWTNFIISC